MHWRLLTRLLHSPVVVWSWFCDIKITIPPPTLAGRRRCPVWNISRDRSRSEIKSCNPKNQMRDNPEKKWYLSQSGCGIKSGINTTFLARNCGSVSVAPELTMPPRRTGFNEYMPQGQRTLTEVDGVVEIGPVGPATQKEVAPAQGAEGGADADAEMDMEVDSLTAGGFFGWMGREQHGAGRVTARAFPAPTTPTAAEGP